MTNDETIEASSPFVSRISFVIGGALVGHSSFRRLTPHPVLPKITTGPASLDGRSQAMRPTYIWTSLLSLTLCSAAVAGQEPASKDQPEVTLKQTDYAGFFKVVAEHKGKVVLVDVWGEF
jgi:hypothetical protein